MLALYIDPDEDAPANDRKLRVLKNKEGTLGEFSLAFDGSTQTFAEYMDGQLAAAPTDQEGGGQNMNLREVVVRTLRFERRRVLAMSRCATRYSRKTMNAPPRARHRGVDRRAAG